MANFFENNFTNLKVKVNFNLFAIILAGDPLEVVCYGDDLNSSTIEITENVSVFIPKEGAIISTTTIVFGVVFFPCVVGATSLIKNGDFLKNKLFEGKQEVEVKNDTSTFNSEKLRSYISSYFSKEAWYDYFSDSFKVQPEAKLLLETASSLAVSYFALKLLKNTFSLSQVNKKILEVIPEVEKIMVNKGLPSGFSTIQKPLSSVE